MESAFQGDFLERDNPYLTEHILMSQRNPFTTYILPKHSSYQILGKNTEKQKTLRNTFAGFCSGLLMCCLYTYYHYQLIHFEAP